MSRSQLSWMLCGLAVLLLPSDSVSAQQRGAGMRSLQPRTRFELATLPEVQAELKLTDEQKKLASELLAKQREKRQAAGQGGFDQAARAELAELNSKSDAEFVAKLNDAQKSRFNGLLVQVNGPAALLDPEVSKSLKLSNEQVEKLKAANRDAQAARREAFQGFQDLSPEKRQETFAAMTEKENAALMAVLNDEQKKAFGELKGAALTIDQSPLRVRRN